jgi:hypothetical protein
MREDSLKNRVVGNAAEIVHHAGGDLKRVEAGSLERLHLGLKPLG